MDAADLDQRKAEFHRDGYTVFRGILPDSLVADLRRAVEPGRRQVRERTKPDAQRFQPISSYDLDPQPFRDYTELGVLREAIAAVLTPRHVICPTPSLGVLIEPAGGPYAVTWHRDLLGSDLEPAIKADVLARISDMDCFNQANCALYQDPCLWVVPGSQNRPSSPREESIAAEGWQRWYDLCAGRTAEEVERMDHGFMLRMPGAVRVTLEAGDFALYRQVMWHAAEYVTYRRRATLHHHIDTPAFVAFLSDFRERTSAPKKP